MGGNSHEGLPETSSFEAQGVANGSRGELRLPCEPSGFVLRGDSGCVRCSTTASWFSGSGNTRLSPCFWKKGKKKKKKKKKEREKNGIG